MCRILLALIVMCVSLTVANAHDERDGRFGHDHDRRDETRLPMVYDAQGRVIGPLAFFGGVNGVYLSIDGLPVFASINHKQVGTLQYSASEYEWVANSSIGFASTDCSGGALVPNSASPIPVAIVRDGVDATLYIAVNGYSGSVHVFSLRTTDSTTGAISCTATSFDEGSLYWAVRRSYPLTQNCPEPLHVAW
jgi:hypothetical protein